MAGGGAAENTSLLWIHCPTAIARKTHIPRRLDWADVALLEHLPLAVVLGDVVLHVALDLDGSDRTATLVGHLAVTPFHVLDATNAGQHVDDAAGAAAQADELARAMRDGRLVGGSLWPAPGYGTVTSVDPIEIAPAAT